MNYYNIYNIWISRDKKGYERLDTSGGIQVGESEWRNVSRRIRADGYCSFTVMWDIFMLR